MKKLILLAIVMSLLTDTVFCSTIDVELPKTYQIVPVGENLWFKVNLALPTKQDIKLRYDILDVNNHLLESKSETVVVLQQTSHLAYVSLPENLTEGKYTLRVTPIISDLMSESRYAEVSFSVIDELNQAFHTIKSSLFDIFVEIPEDFRIVKPGGQLLASIKLINLGTSGRVDVFLDYVIINTQGKTILKKKETVAVETQANFVRMFTLSDNLDSGEYTLYAQLTYADGKYAAADHSFAIKEVGTTKEMNPLFLAIIILVALVILTFLGIKSKPIFERNRIKHKVDQIVNRRTKKE